MHAEDSIFIQSAIVSIFFRGDIKGRCTDSNRVLSYKLVRSMRSFSGDGCSTVSCSRTSKDVNSDDVASL